MTLSDVVHYSIFLPCSEQATRDEGRKEGMFSLPDSG